MTAGLLVFERIVYDSAGSFLFSISLCEVVKSKVDIIKIMLSSSTLRLL